MLENLKIVNGELSLEFDPLVNLYTVLVEEDIEKLDFEYVCATEICDIEVIGNIITGEENTVVVNVFSENKTDSYKFIVNKKSSDLVFHEENIENAMSVESNTRDFESYEIEYLIIVVLVLIAIMYKILLSKPKKN